MNRAMRRESMTTQEMRSKSLTLIERRMKRASLSLIKRSLMRMRPAKWMSKSHEIR